MEGGKMRGEYVKGVLLPTLDALVVAVCADYERRESLLRSEVLSLRTRAELRYLNYIISTATAEIAEPCYVNLFIDEIGSRTGFAHSAIEGMGEEAYKIRKMEIKRNIAKKLHFCD